MSTMTEETIDNFNQLDDVVPGSSDADYVPPSEFIEPPPAGVYTFQRTDGDDAPLKTGRAVTKKGTLMAWFNFRAQISGGPFDGRTSFVGINTYVGDFRPSCSAADFIRAAKSSLRPTTISGYEEAIGRAEVTKITKTGPEGDKSEVELPSPLLPLAPKVTGPFNANTTWEWTDSENTVFLRGFGNPKSPKKYTGPKINVRFKTVKDGDKTKKVVDHVQVGPDGQEYGARLVVTDFVVPKVGGTVTARTPAKTVTNMAPAEG